MSKFLQPCIYTQNAIENQLRNCLISAHDLCCGCTQPLEHINHLTTPQCLSTDGGHGTATDIDAFDAGDLEKLFDEDVFGDR